MIPLPKDPAFPRPMVPDPSGHFEWADTGAVGMDIRTWLAGQILAACVPGHHPDAAAANAVAYVDALLRKLSKPDEEAVPAAPPPADIEQRVDLAVAYMAGAEAQMDAADVVDGEGGGMTRDEKQHIEDAISELLAWGHEDRYRRVSCDVAVAALRGKLAALSTPAPVGEAERLREALTALVRETERCDRPGLYYGVGTDDPVMVAARAALASPAPLFVPVSREWCEAAAANEAAHGDADCTTGLASLQPGEVPPSSTWGDIGPAPAPPPAITREHLFTFLGWLCAELPELHQFEVPRMAEAYAKFCAIR